jgi:K+-sensing histidine kinase KdpD
MTRPAGGSTKRNARRLMEYPLVTWLVPILAPLGAAALLVPSRGHLDSADDALILVLVTVAVASRGHRAAAALCALISALSFDYFLTVPYQSFRISSNRDVITEVLFVVVGLLVGELATRGQRHRRAAVEGRNELARLHHMAERIADGEEPDFVLMAVAAELRELLSLEDCRFVREPPSEKGARIDPDGTVRLNPLQWPTSAGLPTRRVELPVRGGGRNVGTFILTPTASLPISQERCVVAVALADQLGSMLSSIGPSDHDGAP